MTGTTLEDRYENNIEFRTRANSQTFARVRDDLQRNISRATGMLDPSDVGTERPDEIADAGLSGTNGDRSPRRGKTEASAGGARSDGGARSADTAAERIRAVRDNNLYRGERAGPVDKDRQDRRSVQRDVEEEEEKEKARGSRPAADGKRIGRSEGDTEDATAEENGGGEQRRGGSPYRRPRARERETRWPDNGMRKIGRLDPAEEEAVLEIPRKPAKRPGLEREGNDRRDRRENEELVAARRDRRSGRRRGRHEEEGSTPVNKGKGARFESKKTMDSLDDAEKGRRAVNEEERLPMYDEKHKGASIGGKRDADVRKKWKTGKFTRRLS